MMTSLKAILAEASSQLTKAGIENATGDARLLLAHALSCRKEDLLRDPTRILTTEEIEKFNACLERRLAREPVARILGRRDFWKLSFALSPATLDPRPDSESLIEAVLSFVPTPNQPLHILDLGTGTGCLLLCLLYEFPHAKGVGIDIQEEAVAIATQNAKDLKLDDRAQFIQSHWGENLDGVFDLIISNPPYIPSPSVTNLEPEVKNYDPILALDGGQDGLHAYRAIAPLCQKHLAYNGMVVFEIGAENGDEAAAVTEIMAGYDFTLLAAKSDLAGKTRILVFRPATARDEK